ncbi:hypothetical protein SSYM_0364, partial [Serratia symbiotica str. Tucson]
MHHIAQVDITRITGEDMAT